MRRGYNDNRSPASTVSASVLFHLVRSVSKAKHFAHRYEHSIIRIFNYCINNNNTL